MAKKRIAVIGGGAAGMSASLFCLKAGGEVTLFEKNTLLGKKLGITGKGRCNLTNNCTPNEFCENLTANAKFMYSAINKFTPSDTMALFESLGVPLKTERGNRVFPISDSAIDIVLALKNHIVARGCKIVHAKVLSIHGENGIINEIVCDNGVYHNFDSVILCTGGLSYGLTGSTGDGYRFARELGHTVTELVPSLVGVVSSDPLCTDAQGLGLKNVGVSLLDKAKNKIIYKDFGELLFCHFGLSGPTVLSSSAHMRPVEKDRYAFIIDLKPALDIATLDKRVLSDFAKFGNRDLQNGLSGLLPRSLIAPFCVKCGISSETKVNSVTHTQRQVIVSTLKSLKIDADGLRPIEEAVITHGGIAINEISPSDMRSKLWNNLYFAGEIIDVDAYTGGFNLQIAFSTAYLAGTNAVK